MPPLQNRRHAFLRPSEYAFKLLSLCARHPNTLQTVGLVSPTNVPFTSIPLGKTTYQVTTSVGRALQTYDLKRGLNLVFVTRPQTPADITATCAWKEKVFAAWGDRSRGEDQGLWSFHRGRRSEELELPADLDEPIKQILIFGSWMVGCATTRLEIWKTSTLEHYTTLHTLATKKGDNEITGGVTNMPTYLNKIFVGRKDGWVEIWNVSTGKLIYTILPPSPDCGSVTCLQPSPALSLLAIAYSKGPLVVHNILPDKSIIQVNAGNEYEPVNAISFRTDGMGAGHDGRKDGVMATATAATGDVTFWDLNHGGRVMGVLRSAHNPPVEEGAKVRGGVSKIEFLSGQPVIVTSGMDNSLKTWMFDESPFSPIPRILHQRSGHAAPVKCLQFLPTDFDGAEAGNKWLLSGGQDRSLWGWSLRRDGQSTELSQGNIRKQAKKHGILSTRALAHGPTTSLEDLKAPEITCIASSLNRDGGIGAIPGKQPIWQKRRDNKAQRLDAEISGMTGWESVVTAHVDDSFARTWFWGRKKAGRWAFPTGDGAHVSTVAISPCGTFALVGSVEGGIDMYNLQSGIHRQRFPAKLTPAQAREIRIQQLKAGDDSIQVAGGGFLQGTGRHTKAVTGIIVDSMNKHIVSCSLDGKIKFWDFLTGRLLQQIDWAPMVGITGGRYHAGNDLLVFACDDLSIRVVDLETKKTIREFWGFWDLPTSHLIDAIRLEKASPPALSTNFREGGGTTTYADASGEGSKGLVEAAFDDEAEPEEDDPTVAPAIDQLSSDMMTLSLVPKSRWQTLLHLDLIKQRNKPTEAPKVPEKAPFFLPSTSGGKPVPALEGAADTAPESTSRITKHELGRVQEIFTSRLMDGAVSGDYVDFIEHLKSLSPSTADLELRSLSIGDMSGNETNGLVHFIKALTSRLKSRRDYELTQAWMTVFLRLHFDVVMENEASLAALQEWKAMQESECARLDGLVGYCSGVVGFLRSPRT
ncbi:U3 small nucleolar RNA-associated protein [Verticillium alfalfae VaMs.102]|uniref:U3 small nucleolar RNA-associated protein n=1 Tax=Verticillium alfalfae (strain VaMs.102 / ATCC MYA-4576 / FGSC 10136) TaxID=526221 RepID=C9SUM7_VERA1|nr:U3 small nucleolar RNA-associated protein [Verticillium alfalfae VaMs.102]EEY22137.1 U3 small nucleolar RNA-associated protein [Verticillium alfalfae VaMs.102]